MIHADHDAHPEKEKRKSVDRRSEVLVIVKRFVLFSGIRTFQIVNITKTTATETKTSGRSGALTFVNLTVTHDSIIGKCLLAFSPLVLGIYPCLAAHISDEAEIFDFGKGPAFEGRARPSGYSPFTSSQ